MSKGRLLQLLEAVIVIAIFIYVFHDVNFAELYRVLAHADKVSILPIVFFEVLYFLSNAVSFWFLCMVGFEMTFWEAFTSSMFAWLVDILIPLAFIEGDIARILYLRTKGEWGKAVGYTIFFRFLSNVTFATFIILTSAAALNFIYLYEQYLVFYVVMIALLILTVLLMAVVVFDMDRIKRGVKWLLGRLSAKWETVSRFEADVMRFLDSVESALSEIDVKNPKVILAMLFLFLQWVSGIMTPYFSLKTVGAYVNPLFIAPGYSILTVFSLASIGVPFMVGSIDAALLTLYLLLGVPKEQAIGATFIGRSITIIVAMAMIYPAGMYCAKRILSVSRLNDIRRELEKVLEEKGVEVPFRELIAGGR